MNQLELKARAWRLRDVSSEFGVYLRQGQALDAVASAFGFGNWNVAAVVVAPDKTEGHSVVTPAIEVRELAPSAERLRDYLEGRLGIILNPADAQVITQQALVDPFPSGFRQKQ